MDLAFLILSTCLHLGGDFSTTKMCQTKLTTCYNTTYEFNKTVSTKAIVIHCILKGEYK